MIQTRQMILTKYGGPELFQEVETGIAELRDGEVLIRTHFAGINDTDIMARKGLNPEAPPLPMVLGFEVSGIAASVGQGVESIAEGDSVLALTQFGGYSSHVVVPQRQVRKVAGKRFPRGSRGLAGLLHHRVSHAVSDGEPDGRRHGAGA